MVAPGTSYSQTPQLIRTSDTARSDMSSSQLDETRY